MKCQVLVSLKTNNEKKKKKKKMLSAAILLSALSVDSAVM